MRKKEKRIDFINDILSKIIQIVIASAVIGPIVAGNPNIYLQGLGIMLIAGLVWFGLKLIREG